jgi:peptide/nickel transport system ATP-binding protein
MTAAPLIEAAGLAKRYALPRESLFRPARTIDAVAGVDLAVIPGRNVGVVGQSGSGKSTLARLLLALEPPTAGNLRWQGVDVAALTEPARRLMRRNVQIVFQDPFGSLDPRLRVGRSVAEPVEALDPSPPDAVETRVAESLRAVGLSPDDRLKFPHEFSGGQRQRIAIARALITRPKLIVADEPVSALDVSVQAQILNLLQDLREAFGITYVLISHDLSVVRFLCDDVAVMDAGRIVERGPTEQVLAAPTHPYTRALLDAVPRLPEF